MDRPGARSAGLALLAMSIAAPVAVFGLLPRGHLVGAAAILFAVALLDVFAALTLHVYFRASAPALSVVAACLRIGYAVMLVAALRHLVLSAFPVAFQHEWAVALGVFGLHLLALGTVVFRHGGGLRLLGGLVLAAGGGYVLDGVGSITSGHAYGIAGFTFVGEIALMIWLLFRAPAAAPMGP
jgi:hypothetical protein